MYCNSIYVYAFFMGEIIINKGFAYRVLKEDLFAYYNINTKTDENLLDVLKGASVWDEWAIKYLQTSPEIQKLLQALQGMNDSYTLENFDAIHDYLKKNPDLLNDFYLWFDDFYFETINEMIHHMMHRLFWLQSIEDMEYLIRCIKKGKNKLKKVDYPKDHNELTFVVKTTFDIEDGALVSQLFMGKTQDVKEEEVAEIVDNINDWDDEDEKEVQLRLDPIDISSFICVRKKRETRKLVTIAMIESMSYGKDLFEVFNIEKPFSDNDKK